MCCSPTDSQVERFSKITVLLLAFLARQSWAVDTVVFGPSQLAAHLVAAQLTNYAAMDHWAFQHPVDVVLAVSYRKP